MPGGVPPCRLAMVFAREAPIVVILRRGPTRWVEVIQWRTDNDRFEDGQWLHGRIYGERCGLSPNGKLFVYFAMRFGRVDTEHGYKQTFTAVSRPPYLTALAMWPHGDTWGGGGRFVDDRTLRLAYGAGRTNHPGTGTTEIYMAPLHPPHPRHLPEGLRIETDLERYEPDTGFVEKSRDELEWIGKDHSGRRIVARDGRLFAARKGTDKLLRDFNGDERREVASPDWAKRW